MYIHVLSLDEIKEIDYSRHKTEKKILNVTRFMLDKEKRAQNEPCDTKNMLSKTLMNPDKVFHILIEIVNMNLCFGR